MTHVFTKGEYKTRSGDTAVVLADDVPGMWPLMGYYTSNTGCSHPTGWAKDGRCYVTINADSDLLPPVTEPESDPYTRGWNEALEAASVESIAAIHSLFRAIEVIPAKVEDAA